MTTCSYCYKNEIEASHQCYCNECNDKIQKMFPGRLERTLKETEAGYNICVEPLLGLILTIYEEIMAFKKEHLIIAAHDEKDSWLDYPPRHKKD